MNKYMWILDPGHGGRNETKGKRSPVWEDGSQYFEGEGNRILVKMIADQLSVLGYNYVYTVDPANQEDVPLEERVKLINSLPYKHKLGISVHSDGFNNPSAHGWTVYTSVGQTMSDKMATVFYNEAKNIFKEEKFRTDKYDGDPDKESQFYILRKTACPFILLENFFHTNPRECKEILMTVEGRRKIVTYIINAIKYIESNGLN